MIWRRLLKVLGWCLLLLVAAGLAAPYFSVDRYIQRLHTSLERSLGRKVDLEGVHFSLFRGPGFTIQKVTIYEDPAIGIEPVAYIDETGLHGGGAEHLVAAGREVRDRFDFARRGEYQSDQVRSGGGMGPLEFRVTHQPVADSLGARDSCAQRPHPLQIRRHQERLLSHRGRIWMFSPAAGGDWKISLQGTPGTHRSSGARPGIVPHEGALVRRPRPRRYGPGDRAHETSARSPRCGAGRMRACTAP